MIEGIYIIGCGGFGRETEHVIRSINAEEATWNVLGFADDSPSSENVALVRSLGHEVVGGVADLLALAPSHYVIGIGNGQVRRKIDERLTKAGWQAAKLIHPKASLGHDVELGPGTIVCAGVSATTNIRCGRHVHLNPNATIGHDSVLDDYVSVNPLAAVSGWVHIMTGATVGACACILQNLEIGVDAMVGAGAVVVRPVPRGATVKGVPAR